MVLYFLLALPMLCFGLSSDYCLAIQCSSESSDSCIEVTANLITVSECALGSTCTSYSQLSAFSNTWRNSSCIDDSIIDYPDLCIDESFSQTVKPGYTCCVDSNCVTDLCENGICQGLPINSNCTSTSVCMAGTYCSGFTASVAGKCAATIDDDAECTKDSQCGPGYGCNQGYCTQLYSVYYSKKSSNKKFCVSNYMTVNGYCDAITVSINGETISDPFECTIGDVCSYNSLIYSTMVDEGACLCAGLNSTKGYCSEYMNIAYDLIGNLYENLQYDSSNCAEDLSHSGDVATVWQCGAISDDQYSNWYYINSQFTYWGLYQSGVIDDCATSIGLFDSSYNSATYLAMTAVILWLS